MSDVLYIYNIIIATSRIDQLMRAGCDGAPTYNNTNQVEVMDGIRSLHDRLSGGMRYTTITTGDYM